MAIVYPQLQGLDAAQVPFVFSPPSPNPALNDTDMMQQQGIVSAARQAGMMPSARRPMDMGDGEGANVSDSMIQQIIQDQPQPRPEEDVIEMRDGGMAKDAMRVQSQGRNGDSMLVHMNPDEYNAMMALGGLGGLVQNGATINPETGLPEMFSFKDILPAVVGVAGAAFGLPTWAVALGTGATTAVTTGDIGKGILSGLGSYALGSLFSDVGASGIDPGTQAAQIASTNAPQQVSAGITSAPLASVPQATMAGAPLAQTSQQAGLAASQELLKQAPASTQLALNQAAQKAAFDAAPSFGQNLFQNVTGGSVPTGATQFDLFKEGFGRIGEAGGVPLSTAVTKGALGGAGIIGGSGLLDPEPMEFEPMTKRDYSRFAMRTPPFERERRTPPEDYRPGIDPEFDYFAKDGKKGNLETIFAQSGIQQDPNAQDPNMRNAIMKSAQQIVSNIQPAQQTRMNPNMFAANAAVQGMPPNMRPVRMQEGGVPGEVAMAGLMDVANDQVKNNLTERMAVPTSANQPRDFKERAIYDQAMLAVQGMLEPEEAQSALESFVDLFGEEALQVLMDSAKQPREEGGVIKPASGEDTVAEGAMQGEDIIAGKIVDPMTGEESANLRVGENEYIEPADSLARRAMASGLAPTPDNGAMVRAVEEEQLRQAFG